MPSAPLLFTGCELESLKIEKMILCASVMKEQRFSRERHKQSTNTVPVGVYKCEERAQLLSLCITWKDQGNTQIAQVENVVVVALPGCLIPIFSFIFDLSLLPEKLLLATGFKCLVYIRFVSYFLCLTSLLNNLW